MVSVVLEVIMSCQGPSNWRKRCLGTEGVVLRYIFYRQWIAVERYQSTFKIILNSRSIPVRGLVKVNRHIYGALFLSQINVAINWRLQQNSIVMPVTSLVKYF